MKDKMQITMAGERIVRMNERHREVLRLSREDIREHDRREIRGLFRRGLHGFLSELREVRS